MTTQLFNEKVDTSALQQYVTNELNSDVANWLKQNVNGNIPYFITATNATSDNPIIDLVFVDYNNNTVNLIRAGNKGTNRSFTF